MIKGNVAIDLHVRHHDAAAFAGVGQRDGAADTRCRAGDGSRATRTPGSTTPATRSPRLTPKARALPATRCGTTRRRSPPHILARRIAQRQQP